MMFGILGHNISYTASPLLHRILAEQSGKSIDYQIYDIEPENLSKHMMKLFNQLSGINVTIPYKVTILPYLHYRDSAVSILKACNTISIHNGSIYGANTDVDGIRSTFSLYPELLQDRTPVIIGSGGAARAMIYTLAQENHSPLEIVTRRPENIELLRSEFIDRVEIKPFESLKKVPRCWINATPLGNSRSVDIKPLLSQIDRFISSDDTLFDLNYRPQITILQSYFHQQGVSLTINGMPMLVGQAIAARKIWFPDEAAKPFDFQAITDRIYHG